MVYFLAGVGGWGVTLQRQLDAGRPSAEWPYRCSEQVDELPQSGNRLIQSLALERHHRDKLYHNRIPVIYCLRDRPPFPPPPELVSVER
jgi:hypothetical protein